VAADLTFWTTVIGFLFTYAGLALGKVPGLRIDRAAIILAGGALSAREAVAVIDHETLVLLFARMAVVAYLRPRPGRLGLSTGSTPRASGDR
jgi:hypothetical protein